MTEQQNIDVLPKRRLTTDACSLIYLQLVGLMPSVGNYQLLITPQVWQEVTAGGEATADFSAVKITRPSVQLSADAGVIQLFVDGVADAVLSDDGRVLRFCRANNIPHFCCLSLLSLLVRDRRLSPESARDCFERLRRIGRYSAAIVAQARQMLAEACAALVGE